LVNLPQLIVSGFVIGIIYSLAGCCIVLIFKSTQVLSMVHGTIMACAALLFWGLYAVFGFPVWLCLIVSMLGIALLSMIMERFAMRPLIGQPMFSSFFMTFGLFLALEAFYQYVLAGVARGYSTVLPTTHFYIGDVTLFSGDLIVIGVTLLIFLTLGIFFRYFNLGLRMRAVSENHELAQGSGINVRRIFSITWMSAGAVAALSGILVGTVMDVSVVFGLFIIMKAWIAALVGGLDSLPGVLIGGIILGVAESVSSGYIDPLVGGGFKEVGAVIIMLLVLMIRPYGLFGQKRIERV